MKVKAVYTNKAPGGVAYRCSFRITEAVYLVERMVDALALEMGVDQIDLRMRSFIAPEQFPYETTTGWTYDSGDYAKTMKVAMDIAGYDELRREQAEKRARGELMGIGVSFFTEGVGAGPRKYMDILGLAMNDGADLRVHPSGKAVVSISAQTQGQGHETTFAQIVAEELGIPPEDVQVRHGDTDRTPYGLGTYGSRSTPVSGAAVAVVARKVRDKARLIAATMLETRPEDLAWEKGRWYVKGDPEKGAMIEEIAEYAYSGQPMPEGQEGGLDAQVIYDPPNLTYPYGGLYRGRRHRPRHRPGHGGRVHRRRRLRRAHQPDGRRRPDPRRAGRGDRDRADGGDHVRRGGQLPELLVHGLPDPDRARVPGLRARRDGHPARTIRWAPRASASRPTWARRRPSSTRSSTRCTRPTGSTTSTCRAARPGCGRRCRAGPSRRNESGHRRDGGGDRAPGARCRDAGSPPGRRRLPRRRGPGHGDVPRACACPSRCCWRVRPAWARPRPARSLAAVLDTPLVRLQCYEGIDAAEALYEWNYPRQLLSIRLAEARGTELSEDELFGPDYLNARPLLRALQHPGPRPAVLLIDEIDRADDDFEAFLLELLGEAAVTIPEIGTVRATHPPVIVLTSNRTRDLHDAVKRRCLYRVDRLPEPAARGGDHPPAGQGRLGHARRAGGRRGGADARLRRAEAARDRRGDRLAGRARGPRGDRARRRAPSTGRWARC